MPEDRVKVPCAAESARCPRTAPRTGKKVPPEFPERQAQVSAICDRAEGLRGAEVAQPKEPRTSYESTSKAGGGPLPKTTPATFKYELHEGVLPTHRRGRGGLHNPSADKRRWSARSDRMHRR